jgi:hypothetical protein
MKTVWIIGLMAVAGGCGDDDDDGAPGAGRGGTGGTGQNVACEPGAGGACQNATDCPKVTSGEARTASQTCGLGCQQDDDPGTCAVACIVQDTSISQGCATCYATLVGCASMNCLQPCAADPASAACNQCQIESGCRGQFDACSGLTTAP